MNKTILSTTGTPLNQQDNGTRGGYIALGMVGNKFAVFSLLNKQVQILGPSDLKEMNLKALFGAQWCEQHYNEFDAKKEEVVFNHKRLATDILSACQAAGTYSETAERRVGVWKMNDGQLVVNGRQLWRADGTVLEHGIHEGQVYPVSGDVGFDLSTPMATREDVNKVLAAFNSPQWIHPMAGELVLGFLGMSLVSSALSRRPHVLMTGPAACGKSTVLGYVRLMLGRLAHSCTGPQNLAGLYQSIGGTSKAVINDEFEADSRSKSCKETFEIARMSYSMQEEDKGIVRGTSSGNSRSYINQLRNGIRKVSHISNEFARSCANYLGVPTVVVKLVSGSISLSDFAWPAVDEDMVVERAFQRMLSDPNVRPSLPRNAHKLPVPAKRAMVMMYADITGVDIFGVRQLPDIVHWLQRAAIVHDGHEGQAMEAKLHRQLMSELGDLASHIAS